MLLNSRAGAHANIQRPFVRRHANQLRTPRLPLEVISADQCGPMVKTNKGVNTLTVFVCDSSKYVWCHAGSGKNSWYDAVRALHTDIKLSPLFAECPFTSDKIMLHTDGDHVLTGSVTETFEKLLLEYGWRVRHSPPGCSTSNSIAERMLRTICARARYVLLQSATKPLFHLWPKAIGHVARQLNGTSSRQRKSPAKLLTGYDFDLSKVPPFGTICVIPPMPGDLAKIAKLEPRGIIAFYLLPDPYTDAHLFLVGATRHERTSLSFVPLQDQVEARALWDNIYSPSKTNAITPEQFDAHLQKAGYLPMEEFDPMDLSWLDDDEEQINQESGRQHDDVSNDMNVAPEGVPHASPTVQFEDTGDPVKLRECDATPIAEPEPTLSEPDLLPRPLPQDSTIQSGVSPVSTVPVEQDPPELPSFAVPIDSTFSAPEPIPSDDEYDDFPAQDCTILFAAWHGDHDETVLKVGADRDMFVHPTLKQAMQSDEWPAWQAAARQEGAVFTETGAMRYIGLELPSHIDRRRVVPLMLDMLRKMEGAKEIKKKVRLLIVGSRCKSTFSSNYAPTASGNLIRFLTAYAALTKSGLYKLDVKSAFLQSARQLLESTPEDELLVVYLSEQIAAAVDLQPGYYFCSPAVYGHEKAPQVWNRYASGKIITKLQMDNSVDPCLFTRVRPDGFVEAIALFVDDALTNSGLVAEQLSALFPCTHQELTLDKPFVFPVYAFLQARRWEFDHRSRRVCAQDALSLQHAGFQARGHSLAPWYRVHGSQRI